MTLQEFIQKWQGNGYQENSNFGYQCVAAAKIYIYDCWGIQPTVVRNDGGAKNVYFDFPNSMIGGRGDIVELIPNTPDGVPNAGDVIIWGANMGGGYGHIAIVTDANKNTFTVLQQNGGNGDGEGSDDYFHIANYPNYNNVLGWLHFKTKTNYPEIPNSSNSNLMENNNINPRQISDQILDEIAKFNPKANEGYVRARHIDGFTEFGKMLVVDFLQPLKDENDRISTLWGVDANKVITLQNQITNLQSEKNKPQNLPITAPTPTISQSIPVVVQDVTVPVPVNQAEFKSKLTVAEAYFKNNLSVITSFLGLCGFASTPNQIVQGISLVCGIVGFAYPLYLENKKSK